MHVHFIYAEQQSIEMLNRFNEHKYPFNGVNWIFKTDLHFTSQIFVIWTIS